MYQIWRTQYLVYGRSQNFIDISTLFFHPYTLGQLSSLIKFMFYKIFPFFYCFPFISWWANTWSPADPRAAPFVCSDLKLESAGLTSPEPKSGWTKCIFIIPLNPQSMRRCDYRKILPPDNLSGLGMQNLSSLGSLWNCLGHREMDFQKISPLGSARPRAQSTFWQKCLICKILNENVDKLLWLVCWVPEIVGVMVLVCAWIGVSVSNQGDLTHVSSSSSGLHTHTIPAPLSFPPRGEIPHKTAIFCPLLIAAS